MICKSCNLRDAMENDTLCLECANLEAMIQERNELAQKLYDTQADSNTPEWVAMLRKYEKLCDELMLVA